MQGVYPHEGFGWIREAHGRIYVWWCVRQAGVIIFPGTRSSSFDHHHHHHRFSHDGRLDGEYGE
jgi:hypothetical protein